MQDSLNAQRKAELYQEASRIIEEVTGGDTKKVAVFARYLMQSSYTNSSSEREPRRYLKQHELTALLTCIISGDSYQDALVKVSEEVLEQVEVLVESCKEPHNLSILKRMYKIAEEDVQPELSELLSGGFITKSDYNTKVRPRTGLKRIEKAVAHKIKHDNQDAKIIELEQEISKLGATSAMVNQEVDGINQLIGRNSLTTKQKVLLLLDEGFSTKTICDSVGCSESTVSRVRTEMNRGDV